MTWEEIVAVIVFVGMIVVGVYLAVDICRMLWFLYNDWRNRQ